MKSHVAVSKYKFDLVLLTILLIVGIKYIYGVSEYTDIALYDESIYLHSGLTLFQNGFPNLSFSPLYAIYYYILSIFQHDPIKLYYLNYIVLTAMMPVLFYLYLRMFGIFKLPSFFLSIILLISNANYGLSPKVCIFALYIILFSTIFIRYQNKTEYKFLLACISLFIASFARPEFMASFIIMFSIFAMYSIRCGFKYKNYTSLKMVLGLLFLASLSYLIMDGLPIFSKGGPERSFVAFGQHFAINCVERSKINIDPWTNWEVAVRANFGSAKTIKQALMNNPAVFFLHIKQNIIRLPAVLFNMIGCRHNLILPGNLTYWLNISLILIISLALTIKLSKLLNKSFFLSIKAFFKKKIILLLFMSAAILPCIVSGALIYPAPPYLLLLVVMILTIIGIFISSITSEPNKLKLYISYSILFVFIVPCLSNSQPKYYLIYKETIQTIQNLHLTKSVNLLDIDGGYSHYLTSNFRWVLATKKNANFDTFLLDKKINMIVVSDRLNDNLKYRSDKKWSDFLSNYNKYGFNKIRIPGAQLCGYNKFILLHNSLK